MTMTQTAKPASALAQFIQRLGQAVPPPVAAVPLALAWQVAQRLQALPVPIELNGHTFDITVKDAGLTMRFTCRGSHLVPTRQGPAALSLRANLADFMRMAAGDMDADTLFFQRRLSIEGDTELGLIVKNWLDSVERPPRLVSLIHALIP